MAVTASRCGNGEETPLPLMWFEETWLQEFPNHTVPGSVYLYGGKSDFAYPLEQEMRSEKTGKFLGNGYTWFRGQPGVDDQPQVFTVFGQPDRVQTDPTIMHLYHQSRLDFGTPTCDVLHTLTYFLGQIPPPPPPPPAVQPADFESFKPGMMDGFDHYGTDLLGGATLSYDPYWLAHPQWDGTPWPNGYGPCYGCASQPAYGAKSWKWPTLLGTGAGVERPGRDGVGGQLVLPGHLSCAARYLTDVEFEVPESFSPRSGSSGGPSSPASSGTTSSCGC